MEILKICREQLGHGKYDVVTCNPPYFTTPSKEEINQNEHLAIASHEILCTLRGCCEGFKSVG